MTTPGGPIPEGASESPDVLATLVAQAASGDERAWEDLVHRYAKRVFALAQSRLRRPELAEEITQSVFVTLATKLRKDGYTELGRFEPWLFRVTMNRVRDEARRAKRQATPHAPDVIASMSPPADTGEERMDVSGLRDAMTTLGDADREIIELRHHGQMSFKEIADMLGSPVGTVLARHHRALKKLRTFLEANDRTEDGNQ
ncbi:MAG: RNA polymerase sigma factor [Phycisphaerales bacterium]